MVTVEFTTDKSQVGKSVEYLWDAKTATATSDISGANANWRIIDQGRGNHTGSNFYKERTTINLAR